MCVLLQLLRIPASVSSFQLYLLCLPCIVYPACCQIKRKIGSTNTQVFINKASSPFLSAGSVPMFISVNNIQAKIFFMLSQRQLQFPQHLIQYKLHATTTSTRAGNGSMGHGSNGSPKSDGSRGSWVTRYRPMTYQFYIMTCYINIQKL